MICLNLKANHNPNVRFEVASFRSREAAAADSRGRQPTGKVRKKNS
jgi:hypothetical protein